MQEEKGRLCNRSIVVVLLLFEIALLLEKLPIEVQLVLASQHQ